MARSGPILGHLIRLKSKDEMRKAARAGECQTISALVDKITGKKHLEARVGKTSEVDKTSEISLDSDGYPRELQTPLKQKILTKGKVGSPPAIVP